MGLVLSALYIQFSTASILVLYLTIGLFTGLGFGLMYLPAMDIVEHFFSRRLGLAMGLACCGSGFGQFVLAPLLNLATEQLGLPGTLYCLSATVAAAVFFALLYRLVSITFFSLRDKSVKCNQFDKKIRMPSKKEENEEIEGTFKGINSMRASTMRFSSMKGNVFEYEREREMTEKTKERITKAANADSAEETDEAKGKTLKLYTSVLSSPAMILLLLSHFLLHLGIFAYFSFSTDRAIQFVGLNKGESSVLLSIIGVSNCLGRVLFGQLLDR